MKRKTTDAAVERAAKALAKHFGYDWNRIDLYRTGSTIIPSSNDECSARIDFMTVARIALETA